MSEAGLTLFISYAHEDESFRRELEKHLAALRREGLLDEWHDRMITGGQEWERQIHATLDRAHIVILLVSPDFMASRYCNEVEVKRAMQRHEMGTARVIPVLVRPTDWEGAPFSKLQALPTDALPISEWKGRDGAFADVAHHLREVCRELVATPGNTANPMVAAAVGDWLETEMVIDYHGQTLVGTVRMELIEKDDTRALVQTRIEAEDFGISEEKVLEYALDRPLEDSVGPGLSALLSEAVPANLSAEWHQTAAGADKLNIGGRMYYTTWVESEGESRLGRDRYAGRGKAWMSPDVPLTGIVKQVFHGYASDGDEYTQTNIVTNYGRGRRGSRVRGRRGR